MQIVGILDRARGSTALSVGTRISVELLLERLANGWSVEMIIESYPRITREDIQAALAFAAELVGEERYIAASKAAA